MAKRWLPLVFMVAVFGLSCGSEGSTLITDEGPALDGSSEGLSESPAGGDDAENSIRVGCEFGPFFPLSALDSVPPLVSDSPASGIVDAMASFLDGEEGGFWPQSEWRILELVDQDHGLLVNSTPAEEPGLWFMTIAWENDSWRWSGASVPGDCELMIEPRAADSSVEWVVDPEFEPIEATDTEIVLQATEQACNSGQPMGDRLRDPEVVESDDAIVILLTAEPAGGGDCRSNPSQRVTVALAEPVGQRTIRDGRATELGELALILDELITEG